jgi:poly(hydroxyalkanoate) granule-associated protein
MNPTQTLKDTTATLRRRADAALGTARDVAYAGLGVVAMVEEEARGTFDALVREGRQVQRGRKDTLTAKAYAEAEDDVREAEREVKQAGRKVETLSKDFEARVVETVGAVLRTMNVPTREDIDSLKKSVDRLNKKAADLRLA